MTQAEQRAIALGATRSYLRSMQIAPESVPSDQAVVALDDLARLCPDLVASQWYLAASEWQIEVFMVDWEKWLVSLPYEF